MQHTLLGEEKFQAGMRLYFKRHDGQAVTCDDFVQAMQDASGIDLRQFKRWYDVAGTPVLDCVGRTKNGNFFLHVKQSMNPPFHIPFAVKIGAQEQVLSLKDASRPSPSKRSRSRCLAAARLLRAGDPELRLRRERPDRADGEGRRSVHRWRRDSGSRQHHLQSAASLRRIPRRGKNVLRDPDPAFVAEALSLPAESFLAEQMEVVDPDARTTPATRCGMRWRRP
jgi:aminopeptidase N